MNQSSSWETSTADLLKKWTGFYWIRMFIAIFKKHQNLSWGRRIQSNNLQTYFSFSDKTFLSIIDLSHACYILWPKSDDVTAGWKVAHNFVFFTKYSYYQSLQIN
jgi:hypothetical protein